MVKHNPAYRDGNYVATATPIPGDDGSTPSRPPPRITSTPRATHTPAAHETVERPRRAAAIAASSTPAPSKLRQSASIAPEDDDNNPEYTGKTFQQAQEQIVRELVEYEEYVFTHSRYFALLTSISAKVCRYLYPSKICRLVA
jgi:hypothetical protein